MLLLSFKWRCILTFYRCPIISTFWCVLIILLVMAVVNTMGVKTLFLWKIIALEPFISLTYIPRARTYAKCSGGSTYFLENPRGVHINLHLYQQDVRGSVLKPVANAREYNYLFLTCLSISLLELLIYQNSKHHFRYNFL